MLDPVKTARVLVDSVLAGDAVGRHTCDLARVLASVGYRVEIWYDGVFTRSEPDIRQMARNARASDFADDADLVVLQYAGWFPLAERIRRANGIKVFWYHGVTPPDQWSHDDTRDLLVRSVFGARLALYCHRSTADSVYGARELSRRSGLGRDHIDSTPLSVDLSAFDPEAIDVEGRLLRHKLKLEERQVLLYVGRLASNKRVDLLVESLFVLRGRCPRAHLVIVGDDQSSPAYREYATLVRERAKALGISDSVILTGKVPSVLPYYGMADVFVLPSEHEGFGVPLVEAMAAGVPVVASNAAAIPWVLGAEDDPNGAAGMLFEPGSAVALADAIASVLQQPELAASLRQKGLVRAQRFGPGQFRAGVIALIDAARQSARENPRNAVDESTDLLTRQGDIALRDYRVQSHVPLVGGLIRWIRVNLTSHLKEAYLDRLVERQVLFNSSLVAMVQDLQQQLARSAESIDKLQTELAQLKQAAESGENRDDD